MGEEMLTAQELEGLVALGGEDDPYPDLPLMVPDELKDGDVLMMLGTGWVDVGGISLPVSWLIRALDGGAYSHSAMVSWLEGEPKVWDHSTDNMKLHPVPLDHALKGHSWCHVYRFAKDGEPLDSERFPSAPLVSALAAHEGDPYDIYLLVMAGVAAVLSRMPKDPQARVYLRKALDLLVALLTWFIEEHDVRAQILICTAVAGLSFWDAKNKKIHDYALQVDIERKRPDGEVDADWDATIADLKHVLAKIWGDLPKDLATLANSQAKNMMWVDVGSSDLPANLVSPSDLEFSRTLQRVGKLAIPGDA